VYWSWARLCNDYRESLKSDKSIQRNSWIIIGEELVGVDEYSNVVVMLTHFDKDTNNFILEPIMNKALDEGEICPFHFAAILDRHLSGKYEVQKYWVWPHTSRTKFSFTEAEIPQILQLRESIGIYGSELKQEYKRDYWVLKNQFNC